jgi:hypothetical protein
MKELLIQAKGKTVFAVVLAFILSAFSANAQSYSIDWHKIAGGGGASAGGSYQINGAIGQPEASGTVSGGNYSMTGGFWSLISVTQTPGAPTLYISYAGNTVTVYWQNVSGCTLQESGCCAGSTGWTTCPWSPVTSNGTNYVSITGPTGSLFFRLCKH